MVLVDFCLVRCVVCVLSRIFEDVLFDDFRDNGIVVVVVDVCFEFVVERF